MVYDGDCRFCTRWRDRMIARDPRGIIEWVSVHDPAVATRFPGIDREDALRQMWVYAQTDRSIRGPRAGASCSVSWTASRGSPPSTAFREGRG